MNDNNPLGELAKDALDVGLFTNNLEPMLEFWQRNVGLGFDHLLKVGGGVHQHRHDHAGSVFKLNSIRDTLAPAPANGLCRLWVALANQKEPQEVSDPDGNAVVKVPVNHCGIEQWAIEVAVGSVAEFRTFYEQGLGLPREENAAFDCAVRCGRSLIVGQVDDALAREAFAESHLRTAEMRTLGYRYTTIQVRKVDAVHASVIASGALEGRPPATLGTTARISFVRDLRGNWMELSQRASLTGSLD